MKKTFSFICLGLVLVLSFAFIGCDNREKLYILNWDEYMDEELIAAFEKEYNVKVVYDVSLSNENMYNKISTNSAPYDIVIPSDYMIDQLRAENLIQEIDFTKLTNYNEDMFDETLLELLNSDDCIGYKNYTVPYFWGSLGIMYNTSRLTEAEQNVILNEGWAVLFDNTLLPNKNVGMYESSRDCIAAAELYLGYSLNTNDDGHLENVKNALLGMDYALWGTDALKESVASGTLDYSLVYSGDYFDVLYSKYEESDDPTIDFKLYTPIDANNVFFDGMVIPTISNNTELAYKFIDFILTYENSLQNAQCVGYCSTIDSVYNAMLEDEEFEGIVDDPAYYPGDITGGEVYKYLGNDLYRKFDEIFTAVKSR